MGSQKLSSTKKARTKQLHWSILQNTERKLNHYQSSYQKQEEGTLLNSFYEAHITVIPKSEKATT